MGFLEHLANIFAIPLQHLFVHLTLGYTYQYQCPTHSFNEMRDCLSKNLTCALGLHCNIL
ncbi:unnamed protein product [Acanthoscelides obtectus]|uniref:Uncharacterized protein n=1 Tax=Acanthoscelides obtectus TaxID=200917 RepID=A0A9P0L3W5_ACAOB|nr:unnamed protein product [Acanthoscelides obtectus]CAK1624567.1 hypothetical protein AOBTE_LOCUS2618 [Acanthoscelides obtectus]